MTRALSLVLTSAFAVGCGDDDTIDLSRQVILDVKNIVAADITNLVAAAEALRNNAPPPDTDGWNAMDDAAAVNAMKDAWRQARVAYERIEGAIAVVFPDLDTSTDERYDGFIAEGADPNLFDGRGVTGMHAIERILWADLHRPKVIAFEAGLARYTAAAFPRTMTEATDFRDGLAQRLVDDANLMNTRFGPLALDLTAAYKGVVDSMAEQVEKVSLAQTGKAESRYAQHTLADMRANLAGGLAFYDAFSAWIIDQNGGATADGAVRAGFQRIRTAYSATTGAALPAVPVTWNASDPSAADLATPYGQLWSLLQRESNPGSANSLVSSMVRAAALVGLEIMP